MKYTIVKTVGRRAGTVKTPNGTRYFMFLNKPLQIDTENSDDPALRAKQQADVDWFKEQPAKFSVEEGFGPPAEPEVVEPEPEPAKPVVKARQPRRKRRY